ncbi:MAG: hypothetical protein J5807_03480 [Kiritimatiellae bacterium]|nr:hypothetical protein [Kiritimatiellia bacterium]
MKRITLFAGHYGSGKTNIALAYARRLRRSAGGRVAIADLDIVNPYFRTKDFAPALLAEGIELVVSDFANSNVDFPAMPSETYALVADRDVRVVMDVGGDDRGALALGRYVDDIREEGDYEMVGVVNACRPLTRTVRDAVAVLREIEGACSLKFTALANNTNLGAETVAETVLSSLAYAQGISAEMGVPVIMTSCMAGIAESLCGKVEGLFPLETVSLVPGLGKPEKENGK